VILVIAVALWIVWVAPYVLRNGRHQLQPAGEFLADVIDLEPADPQAGKVMMMMAQQENPMTRTQRTGPVKRTADVDGARKPAATGPAFKIRYGRLALALAGVLSLLTGVVSAALRIFGVGTAWLPVVTLLGTVAAVVLLRRLAVRDRRRKVNAAFRAAMSAPARSASVQSPSAQSASAQSAQAPGAGVPAAEVRQSVKRPESPLFDAQSGLGAPKSAPKALTAQELRQAAMAEAAASGDTSVRLTTEGSSWEPVEVPKPTYVEAPKAERAAPEPLDLPEAPKAVGKPSLKQGLAQSGRPLASEAPTGDSDAKLGKAQSALSNLDDVLQRRRA
jgi:predicted lipid-binding transport protein (Tim44 family)